MVDVGMSKDYKINVRFIAGKALALISNVALLHTIVD